MVVILYLLCKEKRLLFPPRCVCCAELVICQVCVTSSDLYPGATVADSKV